MARRIHAIRKARERYGLLISFADIKALTHQIENGQTGMIFQQSHRVKHHLVRHNGVVMRAVYDCNCNQIITFLPLEDGSDNS